MNALRFLIMAMIFLKGAIGTGLVGPNRSALRQTFGLSETEYGAGIAVIQIGAALGVLLAAPRLRNWNPVRVLMSGLTIQALGFAAITVSPGLGGIAAGWALVSGGMALSSIANNISMDLWPHDPRRGVVLLHSWNAGGKVLGPLIAAACLWTGWRVASGFGWDLAPDQGWRLSFTTIGLITVVVLGVFCVLRRQSESVYAGGEPGPELSWRVLRRFRYWFFVGSLGMIAGGEAAFVSLAPEYFEKVRGTRPEVGTLLLTVHLLGLVAGRFASAYLGRRLSNSTVIAICLACGLAAVPAVLVPNLAVAAVALFVAGGMFSSTWPSFYAQAAKHLTASRAMMPYGSALGNVLGISLCILASGVLADRSLTAAMFFGPAVLWAFGLLYLASRFGRTPSSSTE